MSADRPVSRVWWLVVKLLAPFGQPSFVYQERDAFAIRVEALEAERDRLRAALEQIVNLEGHDYVPPPDYGDFAVKIARAALASSAATGAEAT